MQRDAFFFFVFLLVFLSLFSFWAAVDTGCRYLRDTHIPGRVVELRFCYRLAFRATSTLVILYLRRLSAAVLLSVHYPCISLWLMVAQVAQHEGTRQPPAQNSRCLGARGDWFVYVFWYPAMEAFIKCIRSLRARYFRPTSLRMTRMHAVDVACASTAAGSSQRSAYQVQNPQPLKVPPHERRSCSRLGWSRAVLLVSSQARSNALPPRHTLSSNSM